MTRVHPIIAFVLVGLAITAGAQAETITFSESIVLQPTGWSYRVFLPRFDEGLGELTDAELTFGGHIGGSASYESLDAASADIHLDFAADIVLSSTDLPDDLAADLLVAIDDQAQPFDGVIDFAGPSGNAFEPLSADATQTVNLFSSYQPPGSFTGEEYIEFTVTSAGDSYGTGAGNLLLNFQQQSSADVGITYTYVVPEPAMIGPVLLVAVLLLTRRRALPAPIPVSVR